MNDENGVWFENIVETVAPVVHERWMATKDLQGVTSRLSETGEEMMVPYEMLSEDCKDLDRNSVLAVLEGLLAAGYDISKAGSRE